MNKFVDHLLVVPEDDANKDLAVGFQKRKHPLLDHNAPELARLREGVLPFLI